MLLSTLAPSNIHSNSPDAAELKFVNVTSSPGATKVLDTSNLALAVKLLFKASLINAKAVFSDNFFHQLKNSS